MANNTENEDSNILLLAGGGLLAYLLLKEDDDKDDDNNNGGGGGSTQPSGSSDTSLTPTIPYPQYDYSDEDNYVLQRLLEEEKKKNAELENELRIEYEQQKQLEDEKKAIIDSGIVSETELEELDLRNQGYSLYPNEPLNFYDFYNFADSETALAIHSFTQINAINYLRFRLSYHSNSELDYFYIGYTDKRNGLIGVYIPFIYIEIANPLDLEMDLSIFPYGLKINNCLFSPMPPVWADIDFDSKKLVDKFYSDKYMETSIFEDAEIFADYFISNVHAKIAWRPHHTSNHDKTSDAMKSFLRRYQELHDYNEISVGAKSIRRASLMPPLMICSDNNFFKNFDKNNFSAEVYVFVKDVANNTKRLLTLQMSPGDRPLVAELEKEYISPNKIVLNFKDRAEFDDYNNI